MTQLVGIVFGASETKQDAIGKKIIPSITTNHIFAPLHTTAAAFHPLLDPSTTERHIQKEELPAKIQPRWANQGMCSPRRISGVLGNSD